MSQLTQTLDFARDNIPSTELTEKVGLGLLGLQEYANEYWIFHVLRYIEAQDGPPDQRSPLLTQLLNFATKHTNVAKTQPNTLSGFSEPASPATIQERIPDKLKVVPEIHSLICQVLNFRQKFDAKQASEGPGKSRQRGRSRECANRNNLCIDILATDWDPTVLSRANWKYNIAVKSLLRASSCDGLSPAELQTFQSEFRRTAFICTVRNCERSRFGYPSAVELEDHKTRQHNTGFKCYHQNCRYNDIGFTSSKRLRAHEIKFHFRDLPEIPKTLKRKYPVDGSPKDTGATEAPAPVPQGPGDPPDDFFEQYCFDFMNSTLYTHGWQRGFSITERVKKAQDL